MIAQRIGLAAAAPKLFQGTFGDNVLMPIRRRPLGPSTDPDRFAETLRAGNSVDPFNTDWDDVEAAGVTSRDELRRWWVRLIEGMGPGNALFRRGLDQQFSAEAHPDPSTDDERWHCVDIRAVRPLPRPVTMKEIKAEPRLKDMVLANNSRLSVQPVSDEEWAVVLEMAES